MNFAPFDTGPVYVETKLAASLWLVEPWNTLSNLAFLLLVLYWARIAREGGPGAGFLRRSLPVLFVGWAGGTLYHGWRSSELFYVMDYLPIYGLAAATSLWFWHRAGYARWGWIFPASALAPIVWQLATGSSSPALISAGYGGFALVTLLPVVLCERRSGWQNGGWLLASIQFFAIALCFRQFDWELSVWVPRGTHFLWHLFGAAAVHCLLQILVREAARPVPARN